MSDWMVPKFAYWNGSSITDFVPTYPAVKKTPAGADLEAVRHDSISSTGVKQAVLERVDTFYELPFEFIPEADLTAWEAFIKNVIGGAKFDYYPDSTNQAVFYAVTLENMNLKPKWVSLQNYSYTVLLRKFVGTLTYYS